jgi:hypothetical protein
MCDLVLAYAGEPVNKTVYDSLEFVSTMVPNPRIKMQVPTTSVSSA